MYLGGGLRNFEAFKKHLEDIDMEVSINIFLREIHCESGSWMELTEDYTN